MCTRTCAQNGFKQFQTSSGIFRHGVVYHIHTSIGVWFCQKGLIIYDLHNSVIRSSSAMAHVWGSLTSWPLQLKFRNATRPSGDLQRSTYRVAALASQDFSGIVSLAAVMTKVDSSREENRQSWQRLKTLENV